jgi:hypothetical protein
LFISLILFSGLMQSLDKENRLSSMPNYERRLVKKKDAEQAIEKRNRAADASASKKKLSKAEWAESRRRFEEAERARVQKGLASRNSEKLVVQKSASIDIVSASNPALNTSPTMMPMMGNQNAQTALVGVGGVETSQSEDTSPELSSGIMAHSPPEHSPNPLRKQPGLGAMEKLMKTDDGEPRGGILGGFKEEEEEKEKTSISSSQSFQPQASPSKLFPVAKSAMSAANDCVNIAPFLTCISSLATLRACDAASVRHASESVQLESWSFAGFVTRVHDLLVECGLSTDTPVFYHYEEDEIQESGIGEEETLFDSAGLESEVNPKVASGLAGRKSRIPDFQETLLDISDSDDEKENQATQSDEAKELRPVSTKLRPKKATNKDRSVQGTLSSSSSSSSSSEEIESTSHVQSTTTATATNTSASRLASNPSISATEVGVASAQSRAESAKEQLLPSPTTHSDVYRWYDSRFFLSFFVFFLSFFFSFFVCIL